MLETQFKDPEHAEAALLACFKQRIPNARSRAAEHSNTCRQQLSKHSWQQIPTSQIKSLPERFIKPGA